jgi:hypothetical protein
MRPNRAWQPTGLTLRARPAAEHRHWPEREKDETMTSEIDVRSETNDDIEAIAEVTIIAFQTLEISNHTEQFIIAPILFQVSPSGYSAHRFNYGGRCR